MEKKVVLVCKYLVELEDTSAQRHWLQAVG